MPQRGLRKLGFDLEGLLGLAIRDLENFARGNASHADAEVSKLFRARNDAAKMGLSYIDALKRFADRMPPDDADASRDIVARARAALAQPEAQDSDEQNDE